MAPGRVEPPPRAQQHLDALLAHEPADEQHDRARPAAARRRARHAAISSALTGAPEQVRLDRLRRDEHVAVAAAVADHVARDVLAVGEDRVGAAGRRGA